MEVVGGLALIVGAAWAVLRLLALAAAKRPGASQLHAAVEQPTSGQLWGGATSSDPLQLGDEWVATVAAEHWEYKPFSPNANLDGTPMIDEDFDAKGNAFGTKGW